MSNICRYILDNFNFEWGTCLYNIFENRIFHQTWPNPEFSQGVKSLQLVFSFTSGAWTLYYIYITLTSLTKKGSFLRALPVIAGIGATAYVVNKNFNRSYPPEEDAQKLLTVNIPRRIQEQVKVSLIHPTTEHLPIFSLARGLLNMFLFYTNPHVIPYGINALCQIHIFSTLVSKITWLKFSRQFSYVTKEDCFLSLKLEDLASYQRSIGESLLQKIFDKAPQIAAEQFEELLDQLRGIQDPLLSFTPSFQGDSEQ